MGGVSVETGKGGGRRSMDSELNLIPMIDLFICCISFLLITAVWSQMSRINANAQVPGPPDDTKERDETQPEKMLTVEMKADDKFTLIWKSGATVHATSEVPKKPVDFPIGSGQMQRRYPDLSAEIEKQCKEYCSHRTDDDKKLDQAIISVDNQAPFGDVIAVIDSIYFSKRKFKGLDINQFNVTFSAR